MDARKSICPANNPPKIARHGAFGRTGAFKMRSLGVLLSIICISIFGIPEALGKTRSGREREAKKACLNGDPARGVRILTDLYIDTNDLTLIFNQGRCFEMNRLYAEAIGRFREFLLKGENISHEEKADAERHITACQSYLAAKERPEPIVANSAEAQIPLVKQETAPAAFSPAVEKKATDTVNAPPVYPIDQHPLPVGRGTGHRTLAIVLASVGAAALVSAVAINIKVNGMATDLEKQDQYSSSKDSSRRTYETIGWISYGMGAVAVASGVVLYSLGARENRTAPAALVPTFGANTAGLTYLGAF